jgi:glycosyltransferase involved in cell wall biosynthesis
MPEATAHHTARGEDGREVLLSICVPTYNRAPKLARCIDQFERMLAGSAHAGAVEVVISNNESTDDTARVAADAQERLSKHCPVRVYTQPVNLGMEPNFRFLYEHARGRYVWLCSDDDLLEEAALDPLLEDLRAIEPEICISAFVNLVTGTDRLGLRSETETAMVSDFKTGVIRLYAPAKVTQYVLRRRELTPPEQATSERISRLIAWFQGIAVLLFVRYDARILLRGAIVGRENPHGTVMRFSPRVYGMARDSVLMGLGDHPRRAEIEAAIPLSNIDVYVVGHLFRNVMGYGVLDWEIARTEYQAIKSNLRQVTLSSWRNVVKVPVVLALFPLRHRWSTRRRS